jgi:hypothetical protein
MAIAFFAIDIAGVTWCHADPSASISMSEPFSGVLGPSPGVYGSTQLLLPASTVGAAPEYRFEGQSSWLVLDRPLYLGAFVGEERHYTIELRRSADQSYTARYTIDRRAPEPPQFATPSGFVGASLVVGFKGSDDIFISIDGAAFVRFDSAAAPTFSAPVDATRALHAAAYSVDTAGNISRLVHGSWLLAPAGIQPSFALPLKEALPAIQPARTVEGLGAELVDMSGSARLILRVPEGTQPVVAINPERPFSSISSYAELPYSMAGTACEIVFPWGYAADIVVHYGYQSDGVMYIAQTPLRLSPRFSFDEPIAIAEIPLAPITRIEATSATMEWPDNPWLVMVAVDGNEFVAYGSPLTLRLSDTPRNIAYYVQGTGGARSATRSLILPAARDTIVPGIAGVEPGATYGAGISVSAPDDHNIHYEVSDDGSIPPLVSASSAVVPARGLRFEGKAGSVVRYALRLLPEAADGDSVVERFVGFAIDREPPPVPQLASAANSGAVDQIVAFKPEVGQIYVSISDDGTAPFVRYDGPITITGDDDGRRRYIVKSYAEDSFGNRSAPMTPLRLMVDRYSLYVDARGSPDASGTPDDPIPYLDDAIASAASTGTRFIYVRGVVQLRRPVVVQGALTISGGFDGDWNEAPASPATIVVQPVLSGDHPSIAVDGGDLNLETLSIAMQGDSTTRLIYANNGSVSLRHAAIKASGRVETVVLSARGSDVSLISSSLEVSGSATARALDVTGNHLRIENVSIVCLPSVRLFEAMRLADADVSIVGLRIDASPEYALSGLSATRSNVTMERSVMLVHGGIASCRLFGIDGSTLAISSSYIDSGWNGSAQIFSASEGSNIMIANLTAVLDSPRTTVIELVGSSASLQSSIVQSKRGATVLFRSDHAPVAGSIGSNCLWGIVAYIDGSPDGTTIAALDRVSAPAVANFIEDPSRTFGSLAKGIWRLSRTSACVDGGEPAEWSSMYDLFGSNRVSTRGAGRPDIGAEEL